MERYDLMRSGQQGAQPKPNAVLNINEGPVLPGFTPKPRVVPTPEAAPAAK
jgi:general secretion pathway protein D